MSTKYFSENSFEELGETEFHNMIQRHAGCITNNIVHDLVKPERKGGIKSANAYHVMIALCEAGLSKLDEKDVAESRKFVEEQVKPMSDDEFARKFFAAILNIR